MPGVEQVERAVRQHDPLAGGAPWSEHSRQPLQRNDFRRGGRPGVRHGQMVPAIDCSLTPTLSQRAREPDMGPSGPPGAGYTHGYVPPATLRTPTRMLRLGG